MTSARLRTPLSNSEDLYISEINRQVDKKSLLPKIEYKTKLYLNKELKMSKYE